MVTSFLLNTKLVKYAFSQRTALREREKTEKALKRNEGLSVPGT